MTTPENKELEYWDFKNLKTKKDAEAFKRVKESSRVNAFQYLDTKNLEAFKLVPEQERYKVFDLLDYKSLDAFKIIPEKDRIKVFDFLECKDIEALKLIPEEERYKIFNFLNYKSVEALNLLREYDRQKVLKLYPSLDSGNSSKNKYATKKAEDSESDSKEFTLEDFKKKPINIRHKDFLYLNKRDIEAFKLVHTKHRHLVYKHLDIKISIHLNLFLSQIDG